MKTIILQYNEANWLYLMAVVIVLGLIGMLVGLSALRDENKAFEKNKQEWRDIIASLKSDLESERKNNP
ncbi:MAG: hypothetical protein LBS60_12910 [Deltaproteobacteria bacterium]|jgi:hypothetical protein|nr:hypothetical protein [Deltaproteobacteria bacterium]